MPEPSFIPEQARPLYVLTSMRVTAKKRRRIDWPLVGVAFILALFAWAGSSDYDAAQIEHAAFQAHR